MNGQSSVSLRGRNPDVLTCIANLSNDEVFTPPEFANRMLDTLAEAWAADNDGANIWADSSVRFLDPCTKSGVFLREITSRLTKGLADEIPNLEDRVNHVLSKQVSESASRLSPASWRVAACTARSMRRASIRSPTVSPATLAIFGSSALNTSGPTASAPIAGQARRRLNTERTLIPTHMC